MVAELVLSIYCEGESVPCLLASGGLLVILYKHCTDFCLFFFLTMPGFVACRIFNLHCSMQDLSFLILLFIYGFAGSSLLHGLLIVVASLVAEHRL